MVVPAGGHAPLRPLARLPPATGYPAVNAAQLREELAPRVAAKLQARLRGHGMPSIEAEQVAHEIIAMVQAAQLAALADQSGEAGAVGAGSGGAP